MNGQPIFSLDKHNTLIDILLEKISYQPNKIIYTFLSDGETEDSSLTYGELDRRARAIAVLLKKNLHRPGERVLLLYPPGLEYVSAFWGCLYAGMVAVPCYPPRLNRPDPRLQAIAQDAQARVALTTPQISASIEQRLANTPELASIRWLTTQDLDITQAEQWQSPQSTGDTLAFLQYTSGSTAQPKGVMVSHGNLINNLKKLDHLMGINHQTQGVVWLPPYHDMGLIGGLLEMFYYDIPTALMPPTAFLQKPARWLQAISRYRGTVSGGPNFAYEFCAQKITDEQKKGLDLSSWEVAYCGAEPIRKETLERFAKTFEPYGFRREALYAGYGLAEATLIVTGSAQRRWPIIRSFSGDELTRNRAVLASPEEPNPRELVSSGSPAPGDVLLIVDPQTFQPCPDNQVGELWLAGPSIARGYWNRLDETAQTFDAHLAGSGEGPFMRTGDLGFIYDGDVYITGRVKDLIIIRGRNHYPQDIELTVENSHPAIVPNSGAAFSMDAEGEERLVIVQEVDRHAKAEEFPNIIAAIRQAVVEQHELQTYAVVLIRMGCIPKTSSGKIQRRACKAQYLDNSLTILASSALETETLSKQPESQPEIIGERLAALSNPSARQTFLVTYLQELAARVLRIPAAQIDPHQPLNTFGIDSMMAVELAYIIEKDLQISLPMEDFLQGINVSEMTARILEMNPQEQNRITPATEYLPEYPLSHGQRALWFIHQMAPDSAAYNVFGAARIHQQLDVPALQQAFQALIARHPALRTTFYLQGDEPAQRVAPQLTFAIETKTITRWNDSQLDDFLLKETRHPFDLERGPLMRVSLLSRSDDEHILLLVVHHIIVDFWSLAIFVDELGRLYAATAARTLLELTPLPLQYSDYVRWQTEMLAGADGAHLLAYWQQKLSGDLPTLDLPTDCPRSATQTYHGGSQSLKVSADLSRKIKDLSQQHGATLYMTLLAAFQVLLHRYTGQEDILVGSPTAGRSHAELAGLMGYFVNPVVLRADISKNP
ncbi:MAG: condensation domain-containing protein, partial [Anaerolineales bacterium]